MDWFVERARALGVEHGAPKPFVLGRHVLEHGVLPGPHVGAVLKQIYEMQLDGRVTNLDEGLAELDKLLKSQT
jgi:tRNA nucleotidyltransferase (CCA-adding enzyme)